jgi:DNA-binding NtrC family response regulator
MTLFKQDEWSFAEKALELVTTNPFHSSWREDEAEILALPLRAVPTGIAWRPGAQLWGSEGIYSEEFDRRITDLVDRLHHRLEDGASAEAMELERYEFLSFYRLYCECGRDMDQWIHDAVHPDGKESGIGCPPQENQRPLGVKVLWARFRRGHDKLLRFRDRNLTLKYKPEELFAFSFVFRRAFYHIFFKIVGTSKKMAELRSAVWESIVTHDLVAWMQGHYRHMKDCPTLITGPSGTGKELVAEAIGQSQYIEFDGEKQEFKIDFRNRKKGVGKFDFLKTFLPVHVAALPPTLIESELFGTVRGAFVDAIDRMGRLEECAEPGAVFLDEIGELTTDVQVKLLRVLQTRRFQRVGENEDKVFRGKFIAATNRDLAAAMGSRSFREDFYYRLCADKIETPSLGDQLMDRPEDLSLLVERACRTVVGEERAGRLSSAVVSWIEQNLPGHTWPGNFRELEQCVRSYAIRKKYNPAQPSRPGVQEGSPQPVWDHVWQACEALVAAVLKVKASCADEMELKKQRVFDQIKRCIFTLVRARTRTKQEAATLLGIDGRTLEAGINSTDRRPEDC